MSGSLRDRISDYLQDAQGRRQKNASHDVSILFLVGYLAGVAASILAWLYDQIMSVYRRFFPRRSDEQFVVDDADGSLDPDPGLSSGHLQQQVSRLLHSRDVHEARRMAEALRLSPDEVKQILGDNHPALYLFGERSSRTIAFPSCRGPTVCDIDAPQWTPLSRAEATLLSHRILMLEDLKTARRKAHAFGIDSAIFEDVLHGLEQSYQGWTFHDGKVVVNGQFIEGDIGSLLQNVPRFVRDRIEAETNLARKGRQHPSNPTRDPLTFH